MNYAIHKYPRAEDERESLILDRTAHNDRILQKLGSADEALRGPRTRFVPLENLEPTPLRTDARN